LETSSLIQFNVSSFFYRMLCHTYVLMMPYANILDYSRY